MEDKKETLEILREALVDLYLKVKVRSSEDIEKYDSSQMDDEKKELKDTPGLTLVDLVKSNVEILLNIKSDEESFSENEKSLAYPDFFSQASSIMSSKSKMDTEGYEKIIRKLESDVRNLIRSEQQMKVYCEGLSDRLAYK